MKIIFEGPDGGGKSTAIDFIQKRTTLQIFLSGGQILSRADFNLRLEALITRSFETDTFLMDRCFVISEKIYGTILKRDEIISKKEYIGLERMVLTDSIIIYCSPPWEQQALYMDPEFNKDHSIKEGQLELRKQVSEAYEAHFKYLADRYQVIKFDYTLTTLDTLYWQLWRLEAIKLDHPNNLKYTNLKQFKQP